jgi:pimeloyl-ACP methyl ester carboxylesterase
MTSTDTDFAWREGGFGDRQPLARTLDVDGVPISALLAAVPDPRAVIVALHGGSTTAAYFDCPGHPRLSLLRLAPRLGYSVLALDRPGYGASNPNAKSLTDLGQIVDLIYAAVDRHLESVPRGAGLFLMAHSAGCPHAVRVAADERGRELLGLELSGTGNEHHPAGAAVLDTGRHRADPDAIRRLLWQPARLYPPDMVGGASIAAPTPAHEGRSVRNWPGRDFPETAARVRIPVHFTAAEYERVWRHDAPALAEIESLFSAAPRVRAEEFPDSGHNLSLGHTATAYHLRVLAFAEECVVARENARTHSPTTHSDDAATRHGR